MQETVLGKQRCPYQRGVLIIRSGSGYNSLGTKVIEMQMELVLAGQPITPPPIHWSDARHVDPQLRSPLKGSGKTWEGVSV